VKAKVKNTVLTAVICIALLFTYGSVGAMERFQISTLQGVLQIVGGFAAAVAAWLLKQI